MLAMLAIALPGSTVERVQAYCVAMGYPGPVAWRSGFIALGLCRIGRGDVVLPVPPAGVTAEAVVVFLNLEPFLA